MRNIECIRPNMKKMLDGCRQLYATIVYKKTILEKYFNEYQGRILICLAVAAVTITLLTEIYDRRDEDEMLIGFEEYQNYIVTEIDIPTEGDIVLLKKMPFRDYEIKKLSNGNVMLAGSFYYEIRPQTKFAPDLNHTDMYGNTPENSNYWGSMRYGTVLLSMNN